MRIESRNGFFGEFGGCYIPEILQDSMNELQIAFRGIFKSKEYKKELHHLLCNFVGRPTPLIYAKNISQILGNDIYLKFEGLANTGAHKINNAIGQVLLAKMMGKTKIIAETGAGQHGMAVACACAKLKMECKIFMGEVDILRQRPNVFNMELFGAKVISVKSGTKTLKDAVNEALREYSKHRDVFYVLGSALGPYPYPDIVRELQSIIGRELKMQTKKYFSSNPDILIACVGGGSNAIGFFTPYINSNVRLIGVEAGGGGQREGLNAIRMNYKNSSIGIAQGYKSIFIQNKEGQLSNTYSISAGLDYAGIGPQMAYLGEKKRVEFIYAKDKEVIQAMQLFAKEEGIISALESAHALAGAMQIARKIQNQKIIINVSGRGDKDIFITAKEIESNKWMEFLKQELQKMKKCN